MYLSRYAFEGTRGPSRTGSSGTGRDFFGRIIRSVSSTPDPGDPGFGKIPSAPMQCRAGFSLFMVSDITLPEFFCFQIHCLTFLSNTDTTLYSDKKIPGADGAMATARKIIEFFSKSTQATQKLLAFQEGSNFGDYGEEGYCPLRLLQDVITRWWSTYRALKRLRLLKPAIISLVASNEIGCRLPTEDQWTVLHQIEIALKMVATWQRLLEGDKYPTGSLVVMALFQIRKHYSAVLSSEHTAAPVKNLVKILLKDFDENRYTPVPGQEGKVRFTRDVTTGARNRYLNLHPYMFIAAFLDFRCRIGLKKKWMIPEQYDDLRDMILELMVDVAKEAIANATNDNAADKSEGEAQSSSKSAEAGFAFDGAFDFEDEEDDDVENDNDATNEQNIRIRCEASLSAYELLGPMSMKDAEGNFNDPLQRWKEIASQFPELAKLAQEFLSIPATSAPSERIWSRAARVITAKRSQIDPSCLRKKIQGSSTNIGMNLWQRKTKRKGGCH